jgi:hypothetical protein
MHERAAGQDTQKSWPVGITGFGVGVTDQPREAPAGTEARAGETVSNPPSAPSSAPSATITLRGFDCLIARSFPLGSIGVEPSRIASWACAPAWGSCSGKGRRDPIRLATLEEPVITR